MPTPIAKNTISVMNLYGLLVNSVTPGKIGANKIMPKIKTNIESAVATPFLEAIKSRMVRGNRKMTINPSKRN